MKIRKLKEQLKEITNRIWQDGYKKDHGNADEDVEEILTAIREYLIENVNLNL